MIKQLTFTRFLAAISVVFFHYAQSTMLNVYPVNTVLFAGPVWVVYFFVLSGFVMWVADSNTGNPWIYWAKRFARIYPTYLLALLLTLSVTHGVDPTAVYLDALLLQAWVPGFPLQINVPGWSLSVEMFFYLLFPLIAVLLSHWSLRRVVLVIVAFWVLSQAVYFSAGFPDKVYFPLFHLNGFLIGILAGIIYHSSPKYPAILFPVTSLLVLATPFSVNVFSSSLQPLAGLYAPIFAAFILALSCHTGIVTIVFSNEMLVLLGESSYSLYILQVPVHQMLGTVGEHISSGYFFYLYLLVLIIVAVAVHLLFEKPMRRWIVKEISKLGERQYFIHRGTRVLGNRTHQRDRK